MEINGKVVTEIDDISYNFSFVVDITKEDRNELVYVRFSTANSLEESEAISPESLKSLDLNCSRLEQLRECTLKQLRENGIEC